MVDKTEVVSGWPLETGDYAVGDSQSPVAAVTLGSKMSEEIVEMGAAIAGPLHTENLGIEKVVTNLVSNPNIRFLVVCGSEVQGHITGETVKALYENGIDPDTKSILKSPGAIPFVENLPLEAVDRFQEQLTIIDMINNENLEEISAKISECIENDPGCYEEEAMIIELNEKEEESEEEDEYQPAEATASSVDSSSLNLLQIENRIRSMKLEINEIGSIEKFSSGYYAGKIQGIVMGFILTLSLILILFWSFKL